MDNGEVDQTAHGNKDTGLSPVWLVSNGNVLASANLAASRRARRRGLIGVTDVHTPLVLRPCNWVHSVGMKTSIDVAYVGEDGTVLHTRGLRPMRVAPWVPKAKFVIEASSGSFDRWQLHAGDKVEIREP